MFCPELNKWFKTYIWFNKERWTIFMGKWITKSIWRKNCRLIRPPVLHMPNRTARFHLYLDTSKFAIGCALYQIQNGKPKLITC